MHAGTVMITEAHAFTRRLMGRIAAGVTVASPQPIVLGPHGSGALAMPTGADSGGANMVEKATPGVVR